MKISRNLFMVLLPASIFLTWPVSVYAEPSVKETKAFIIDKYDVCGNFNAYALHNNYSYYDTTDEKIDVSFVEDVMHIHSDSVSKTKWDTIYEKAWTTQTSVKLSDLVPWVGETYKGYGDKSPTKRAPKINFECTTGKCIKVKTTVTLHTENGEDQGGLGVSEEKLNKGSLNVCTIPSLFSVSAALLHLIEKSGGKKPLF